MTVNTHEREDKPKDLWVCVWGHVFVCVRTRLCVWGHILCVWGHVVCVRTRFVCVRTRTVIYLHHIWKRLWVIRDTILFQECVHTSWTYVREGGRNSLVTWVLLGSYHMKTYENKKTYSHMNFRVHTRNETRSPEKHSLLDSSYDQCDERFTDPKDIAGLVVDPTWKSVLLSRNRGCENTFCCLTPGLLTVLHVLLPFLPSFTQHFVSEGTRSKNEMLEFFFPFLVQNEQRKTSKAPKSIFSKKKWKENTFFRCSARLPFGSWFCFPFFFLPEMKII